MNKNDEIATDLFMQIRLESVLAIKKDTGFQWIADAGVLNLFGPLVCKKLSCLFWMIC
jgi:hypothetical protein